MKKKFLHVTILVLCLSACQKNLPNNSVRNNQPKSLLSFKSADEIPNEIIPLLYNDLIKDKLISQAEQLKNSYYETLEFRKDSKADLLQLPHAKQTTITGATFPTRTVPAVNVVMTGSWVPNALQPRAWLQGIGERDYDINTMDYMAPDAYASTAPSSSQIMGTTGQSRRLEAFGIPSLQFQANAVGGGFYSTGYFSLQYAAYVQDRAWQTYRWQNNWAGTMGLSKRIESVKMKVLASDTLTFNDPSPSTRAKPYVYYRVHQAGIGWTAPWRGQDSAAGVTGQSLQIEALQVRIYLVKL